MFEDGDYYHNINIFFYFKFFFPVTKINQVIN